MRKQLRRKQGAPVIILAAAIALAGCGSQQPVEPPSVVRTEPPAPYPTVAAKYNERVGRLDQLFARAVVRLKYVDEKGDEHNEQGEGLLQVIRPDRMALSIKKAGVKLFWFGGDQQRYWLFDLVDEPVVRVGRHEFIAKRAGDAGLGMDINPREMIRLLGITPLPADGGTTAWSKNGRFIEAATPITTGGSQVISFEPETFLPRRITLADAAGKLLVSAELENFEPVDIAGFGGTRPRIASRVTAVHPASKTEIKLDLSEMKNNGVGATAFDFDVLKQSLGVQRVIDLDAPPAPRAAGRP